MKWKVAIADRTGKVYTDTNAFKLLYPFPTLAEAEEDARRSRVVSPDIAIVPVDDAGNVLQPANGVSDQGGE